MSNWNQRYKEMKKSIGYKNQDIADTLGIALNSVEIATTKKDTDFPKWAKLAIVVYEQMKKRAKITYTG